MSGSKHHFWSRECRLWAAQRCFGYASSEFFELPSRHSAEAPDRAERQRMLDTVAPDGFVAHYQGVRVGKSGRRFLIENASGWALLDEDRTRHGQAAVFDARPGA